MGIGLYEKFEVKRTDGKVLPDAAVFFLLRLDEHGDTEETVAARNAAIKYAESINDKDLVNDLVDYFNGEN